MSVEANLREIERRIRNAARRVHRSPEEILLVAVTKNVGVEKIREAIRAGVRHLGENRVQEAREKIPQLQSESVTWHMIGHLQKNKVKYAVRLFDMIQSVDSLELAEIINHRAKLSGKKMPVLIEVNTSGEPTKYGCQPEEAIDLLKRMAGLDSIVIRGFMTVGLLTEELEEVRPCFRELHEIYCQARSIEQRNAAIDTLSMGMSADFEIAVEEGSNMLRIGTAIFGPRNN